MKALVPLVAEKNTSWWYKAQQGAAAASGTFRPAVRPSNVLQPSWPPPGHYPAWGQWHQDTLLIVAPGQWHGEDRHKLSLPGGAQHHLGTYSVLSSHLAQPPRMLPRWRRCREHIPPPWFSLTLQWKARSKRASLAQAGCGTWGHPRAQTLPRAGLLTSLCWLQLLLEASA